MSTRWARASRFVVLSAWSCLPSFAGPSSDAGTRTGRAHLSALSTYQAKLGTPIFGYGTQFPQGNDARLQLAFHGTFLRQDGASFPVHTAVDVRSRTGSEVLWDSYGPYGHPFTSRGDEPGTFRGTVGIQQITPDNQVLLEASPRTVTFTVLPSLIVRAFTPLTAASCKNQVLRAFGGLPYVLQVQSLGFSFRSITYTVSAPDAGLTDTTLAHSANHDSDLVVLQIPQVPETAHAYTLLFHVTTQEDQGTSHELSFAIGVHRPAEVIVTGETVVAEIYTPVAVSGCIPGGENNRTVMYTETKSETRHRTTQVQWNESWVRSHSVSNATTNVTTKGFSVTTGDSSTDTHANSNTNGWALTNGFSVSTTDGRDGTWSLGTMQSQATKTTQENNQSTTMSMTDSYGGRLFLANYDPTDNIAHWLSGRSTSLIPMNELPIKGNYSIGHDWVSQKKDKRSDSMSTGIGIKQTMGASTSVSQTQDVSRSLSGSEATTDTQSVTQTQSQTQQRSETQSTTQATMATQQNGMDQSTSDADIVSSSDIHSMSYSGLVLSGMYGTLYRQTIRLTTVGSVVMYDQCGNGEVAGTVKGQDYRFAPDLGVAANCPPLPPSNLEPYQCFDSQCTGSTP